MDEAYIQALIAGAKPPTQQSKFKYVKGQYVDPNEQPKPKQRNKGGFLSSLISEAGGVGGAGVGGLIGTAILPGVGTAIGAGLGGLFGGTTGRLAENKVRDNEFRPGQALGEGLLTGALSAIGPAFQAAKGAKAGKGLASALGGVDEAAGAITKSGTAAIGGIEKKGLGMTSKAGGYFIGATRPGAKALNPSDVKAMDKLLRQLKIPANDAADMLYRIEPTLNNTYEVLNKAVAKSSATVDGKKLAANLLDEVAKKQGLGKAELKIAQEQAAKLSRNLSPSDLLKAKRELDSAISYVANPDAATSSKQAVAEIFRNGLKKELDNAVPGLKKVNSTAHELANIKSFAERAANRTGMEATSGAGGIAGRILSSPLANTARAKTGVATQAVGRTLAGTGSNPLQLGRYAKLQAPGNIAQALAGGMQTPDATMTDTQMTDPTMQAPTQVDQTQLDPTQVGPMATDPMAEQPQYTLRDALADAQSILGSDATPAQYLAYAKALQAEQTTATKETGPNVTKVTAQQMALAQRGKQSLEQLSQLLQSDPTVLQRSATPGRKLPVVGGFISQAAGTGDFDAMGYNVASALLRLETGAQANESEIKNLQTQLMPRAGDSPETVQTKLAQLNQAFDTILNAAYGNDYGNVDSGNSSFADALAAYGGQ